MLTPAIDKRKNRAQNIPLASGEIIRKEGFVRGSISIRFLDTNINSNARRIETHVNTKNETLTTVSWVILLCYLTKKTFLRTLCKSNRVVRSLQHPQRTRYDEYIICCNLKWYSIVWEAGGNPRKWRRLVAVSLPLLSECYLKIFRTRIRNSCELPTSYGPPSNRRWSSR